MTHGANAPIRRTRSPWGARNVPDRSPEPTQGFYATSGQLLAGSAGRWIASALGAVCSLSSSACLLWSFSTARAHFTQLGAFSTLWGPALRRV